MRKPTPDRFPDFKKEILHISKKQFPNGVNGEDFLLDLLIKFSTYHHFGTKMKMAYLKCQKKHEELEKLANFDSEILDDLNIIDSLQKTFSKESDYLAYLRVAKRIGVFSDAINFEENKRIMSPFASYLAGILVDHLFEYGFTKTSSYDLLAQFLPVYCPNYFLPETSIEAIKRRTKHFAKNENGNVEKINKLNLPSFLVKLEKLIKKNLPPRERLIEEFGLTGILPAK